MARYQPSARSAADLVPAVLTICDGGHRTWIGPSTLGEPCWVCGSIMRRPDHVDEAIARHERERRERIGLELEAALVARGRALAARGRAA